VHYTLNDQGEVEFNADARSTYSPWTNGLVNVTLLPQQKGQGADFQQRVCAAYRQLAAAEPDRIRVVDAAGTVEIVKTRMLAALRDVVAL
jgi:hypothetical protein